MVNLRKIRAVVEKQWLRVEKIELTKIIRTSDMMSKTRRPSKQTNPMDERVEMARLTEVIRLNFIEHELRARRFLLLPAIAVWEEDERLWRENFKKWEDTRAACKVLGNTVHMEADPFGFPPACPSYMPSTEKVLDMWERCLKHPRNKGWTEIPPLGPGGPSKKAARRGRNSVAINVAEKLDSESDDDEKPFEPTFDGAVDALAKTWKIDPETMPAGNTVPPDRIIKSEDDE